MHKIFVYGTLRPSKRASHWIEGFDMYTAGAYPYVAKGSSRVYGNVIEVDDDELDNADRYEGVARGLYTREKTTAYDMLTGVREEVQLYVAGKDWPTIVQSGDWYDEGEQEMK